MTFPQLAHMSNFDERSGVVPCQTPWGSWAQTIDEVFIEVNVAEGTKGKDVSCQISSQSINLVVAGKEIVKVIILQITLYYYNL